MDPELVAQEGVGIPDALQRLWTPHRMAYIRGENKPVADDRELCPFCTLVELDDPDALVIARGELVYVVLNLYPYNPGHLMVVPFRHVADYTELTSAETVELAEHTQRAMRVARKVAAPHGFNIGMNQGVIAGAGIPDHLHWQLVPRWAGDVNFMPLLADVRVMPQHMSTTWKQLHEAWGTHDDEKANDDGV